MAEGTRIRAAIVDHGLGNLFSVKQAGERAGMAVSITADAGEILASEVIILPGVGAFGDAMQVLRDLDLVSPLRDAAAAGTQLLGVCLGMQLLMSESDEFGRHAGLGIIEGDVVRLAEREDGGAGARLKVPHIGWSRIEAAVAPASGESWQGTPLHGVAPSSFMYFVHSFYARPVDAAAWSSVTTYGPITFCSSVRKGNVFGCQFHPERSGPQGLRMYRNVAALVRQEDPEDGRRTGSEVRTA